jgi:hypothetical protein
MKALIFAGILLASFSLRTQALGPSTFSLAPGDITEAAINTSGAARLKVLLTPKKSA